MSTTLIGTGVVEVKRGDQVPTFWQALDEATGLPVDLTGLTVRLLAQNAEYPGPVIELAIADIDAPQGIVEHVTTGALLVADYNIELEITGGSQPRSAPTCGFARLRICRDLRP